MAGMAPVPVWCAGRETRLAVMLSAVSHFRSNDRDRSMACCYSTPNADFKLGSKIRPAHAMNPKQGTYICILWETETIIASADKCNLIYVCSTCRSGHRILDTVEASLALFCICTTSSNLLCKLPKYIPAAHVRVPHVISLATKQGCFILSSLKVKQRAPTRDSPGNSQEVAFAIARYAGHFVIEDVTCGK